MGGGSSGSSGITVDSGGMAYPTTTGGFDYSALGKGVTSAFDKFGSAVASSGDRSNYMTGAPRYDNPSIPGSATQQQYIGTQTGSMIPGGQGGGSEAIEALLRLLRGMS